MKRAAVIGRPIAHSLSPLIHTGWIEALGLDASYEAFEPEADDFEGLVTRLLKVDGYVGLNVTAPYKSRALAFANDPEWHAQVLGNANVLLSVDSDGYPLTQAWNTDGAGLAAALATIDSRAEFADRTGVVLGAGDAARTAALHLRDRGVSVKVVNRTPARARELAHAVGVGWAEWDALPSTIVEAAILVNATAAVHEGETLTVPLHLAEGDPIVLEMSYRPLWTSLLRQAADLNLRTVDGLHMLIGQARPSFEMFFGVPPPPPEVVDVRALCLAALGEAP